MKLAEGTAIVNLEKNEQDILNGFSKKTRYSIRKAEKLIEGSKINAETILFIAYKDFRPVSMIAIAKVSLTEYVYKYSLTNDTYKNCNANSLLLWEAMKWAKKMGATTFDMGGIDFDYNPKGNAVNKFKQGFNGEIIKTERQASFKDWLEHHTKWLLQGWWTRPFRSNMLKERKRK